MMVAMYTLAILLVSGISAGKAANEGSRVTWSQIMVTLCEQQRRCLYPQRIIEETMVYLLKFTGDAVSEHGNAFKKAARSCGSNITTTELPHLLGDSQLIDVDGERKADRFYIHSPSSMNDLACTMMSMTRSKQFPNILYLLVQCLHVMKCYRNLHLVDLERKKMMPNGFEFCEKEEGERHIFSGPCIKNKSSNCLYSINNGFGKLSVTTYLQPSDTTQNLVTEKRWFSRGFTPSTFQCSISKSKDIFCLFGGLQFYKIELNINTDVLDLYNLKWQFKRFSHIKGFQINDIVPSEAIIIKHQTTVLVKLDFQRKNIKRRRSLQSGPVIITLFEGDAVVHGKVLDQPFCRCKFKALQTCITNS